MPNLTLAEFCRQASIDVELTAPHLTSRPCCRHVFLNSVSDLQKHHGHIINRFYEAFTGQKMHSNPKVRETLMCLELLLSAWLAVREDIMPRLQDLMAKQKEARFDATSFLCLFEERIPLAVLGHAAFLREGGVKAPAGKVADDNGWLWIMCKVAVSTTVSTRARLCCDPPPMLNADRARCRTNVVADDNRTHAGIATEKLPDGVLGTC